MTGKTMMPDNFDEYFEKWLARKITQKEIANELKVSQSVVSNWIIQFRKDTKKDRDYIKTDAFKDALKGYEDKELSTRQAGRMLGITHTGFRKLVMKHQEQQKALEEQQKQKSSEEQKKQKNPVAKEDAPKKQAVRYGIDQLMADLSKESVEHMSERNER
jgi:predicted transcriptional regulator